MRKIILAFIFFLLLPFMVNGQPVIKGDLLSILQEYSDYQGRVNITLDEGIEENYLRHLISNSKGPEVSGYRIRIYSGSGHDAKERAAMVRGKLYSKFPDVNADLRYDSPDYKVYVGDCRTRAEVLKLYERIKGEFPNAFITPKQEIDPEKYKSTADNE